jgi:hypothetical protein
MLQYLNNNDGNELLSEYLRTTKPLSVSRLGVIELNCIYHYLQTQSIPQVLINMLANNAGVYGNCIIEFISEYIECIRSSNIHAMFNDINTLDQQKYILDLLNPSATRIEHRSIEPFYFDSPWSQYLKDKKVLVISPFATSIETQYSNYRANIWDNELVLPQFNLITYKNIQSIGNHGPDKNWILSLNKMKQDISTIDFDIALLGCGAYGNPLVSYIHDSLNKTAIYIGGGLQILFGIKGKRWDNHDEISKMYNQYWNRPLNSEKPELFQTVENGCYW